MGATYGELIGKMRKLMPRSWLLMPGVGPQGASAADTTAAFDGEGLGGLINQSRGILECFSPTDADWRDRVVAAVAAFANEARRVSSHRARPV